MKILIVEDEMIISDDICGMLEEHGYDIAGQAVDYDEAIEIIRNNKPDMVLLDINLQGNKDGIEIAQYINETGRIPFIYTSSLGDAETISRAKRTNPAAYLIKPFQDQQLFAAIEVAMANFTASAQEGTNENKLAIFNEAIFVKEGHRYTKVRMSDIKYIQKSDNYLDVHTTANKYLIRASIGEFIDQLGYDRIYRTHKSYAVNINFITDVMSNTVTLGDIEVPLSRTYADELKKYLRIF
jgi:DNA-binding LytR/AlgR family response regulator